MGRPKKIGGTPSGYVAKKIYSLEGAADIITQNDSLWELLFRRLNRIARVYGFSLVEAPVLEDKNLYTHYFKEAQTKLNEIIPVEEPGGAASLRPKILPSILRAYYEHKVFETTPLSKWWYKGPVFAKAGGGNLFQNNFEYGFEIFGIFTHLAEAQTIGAVWEFMQSLGLEGLAIEINSIGEEACQRTFSENLLDYLNSKKYDLCDSCSEHLNGRVLNVFRCNNLGCQAVVSEAPTILDFLDQAAHKNFTNILEALDELGVPYQLNPCHIGPEGHSKTNFIIKYKDKGQTKVLGEGGYHDGLMQNLCGKNHCCFGFSGNLSLLRELLEQAKITVDQKQYSEVFLVPLGELAAKKSLRLFRDLTNQKISVYDHFGQCGVKNQLKQAESSNAPVALIMGQKEAMDEMVILRDVKSGMQEIISYDKIVEEVKKRLGK